MRLNGKMFIVLVPLVLAIMLAYFCAYRLIFLESFTRLDRMEAQKDMSRCLSAIRREERILNSFTHDWAAWDDMYRFVQAGNRDFAESNLLWEVFRDQKLNLIHIYDTSGRLVWGEAYDLETGKEIPLDLSEDLVPAVFAALVEQRVPGSSLSGFVHTRYGPMLVSSNPILTSEVQGPSRGALVMGRLLKSDVMAQISEQVDVRLSAVPVETALDMDPAGSGALSNSRGSRIVREEADGTLGVYTILQDIAGNPVVALKASVSREIMDAGKRVYGYGIVLILSSGIVLLIAVWWAVRLLVIKPVSRLTEKVLSMEKGSVEIDRDLMSRRDEFGTLSREFNGTINKLLERERGLWLSERRLRQIIDHMPHFIFAKDEDGRYILANKAFADALGCPVQEVIGKKDEDFTATRDSAERYHREDLEVIASGVPKIISEDLFTDAAGAVRILFTTKIPFTFSGTLTPAILGSSVDITQMRKAQELLQYRGAIIEQSLDGIVITDLEGNVQYSNPAWAGMHGYSRTDLEGTHISFFHSENQYRREVIPFFEQVLSRNASRGRIGHMKKGGKEFMTLTSAFILKDQKGAPSALVGLARDISDEIQMEARVNQMQKMDLVGQLAGGIAHDLNNMLTPILGYAEMVLLNMGEGDPHYDSIYHIMTAADRAQGLTRQLLAFSSKQILKMKTVNIGEVVQSYRAIIRRTIREDVEIRIHCDDPSANARVDTGQIGQIIMNLALNAQDAMPDGGVITIETSVVYLDERSVIAHQGMNPGEYVLLMFQDTGTGMSREVLDRIFEPFFTTKERGKGTGLGLSSVYGIVTQHGGYIAVVSEPGKGTIFKIYLPKAEGETEEAVKKRPLGRGRMGEETVIVAEDDDRVRDLACEVLERHGYRVIPASNPQECIRIVGNLQGPIHLMLADVIMPGINGRQLFEILARIHPEMKVIYMSGYTDDVIAHHGVLEKGVNFIQKPFSIQTLMEKVRSVLDEGAPG